ncbi:Alpha carbonic anhydrase 8 [Diplonema papillatum]|nr:Alpha carbonic anhydrase 8 [Diplonema papillatum]
MNAVSVVCILALVCGSLAQSFTYEMPDSWYTSHAECNNNLQSPINLESTAAEASGASFLKLWIPRKTLTDVPVATNDAVLSVDLSSRGITLTGQGFWSQFTLAEMRYHSPSEHLIEGRRFELERQLVFKPSDLAYLTETRYPIIVIAEVYNVSSADPMMDALIKAGFGTDGSTAEGGTSSTLTNFKPSFTFMKDEFFVYPGSLTTPPCTEVVTWYVSGKVHPMSGAQRDTMVSVLQGMSGCHENGSPNPKIVGSITTALGNARPVQEANDRTIKKQWFYSLD